MSSAGKWTAEPRDIGTVNKPRSLRRHTSGPTAVAQGKKPMWKGCALRPPHLILEKAKLQRQEKTLSGHQGAVRRDGETEHRETALRGATVGAGVSLPLSKPQDGRGTGDREGCREASTTAHSGSLLKPRRLPTSKLEPTQKSSPRQRRAKQ